MYLEGPIIPKYQRRVHRISILSDFFVFQVRILYFSQFTAAGNLQICENVNINAISIDL